MHGILNKKSNASKDHNQIVFQRCPSETDANMVGASKTGRHEVWLVEWVSHHPN